MLKNALRRRAVLTGACGGAAAATGWWLVLSHSRSVEPPLWLGLWSYGLVLGLGATVVYLACGGRSGEGAAAAAALGSAAVMAALVVLVLASLAGDVSPGSLPVASLVLALWLPALGVGFLLLPAVVTAVAVVAGPVLLRRLWTQAPERRHDHVPP
jgi:hypothetical protein